jgi:hypothetical protein
VVPGLALEGHAVDPVLRGQGLQLAVTVLRAGEAVERMAGKEELNDDPPGVDDPGAPRLDLHALLYGERAGRGEVGLALDLHHAYAARAAGEQLLDMAQGGNTLSGGLRGLEDGGPRLGLYLPIVDRQVDHV